MLEYKANLVEYDPEHRPPYPKDKARRGQQARVEDDTKQASRCDDVVFCTLDGKWKQACTGVGFSRPLDDGGLTAARRKDSIIALYGVGWYRFPKVENICYSEN